jgi:hypothetical protein
LDLVGNERQSMSEQKHVYTAINAMIETLSHDGISKARRNETQGFAFRGIDDVYNAISGGLARHKLNIIPRMVGRVCEARTTAKGGVMYSVTVEAEFDFVSAVDGSCHVCRMFGEAMDSGDKATNKAMSAAYKYACIQVFCIPTEAESPDADQTTPPATVPQPKPKKTPPASDEQRAAAGIDTGGHPVGSDAAAQHVAAGKLKAAPASFDMLKHFGDMKKALGEPEYYRILGLHGFEKSNEIRELNKAREVYKMMAARKIEIDVEAANNA